ncbi:MAG: RsbRD N-terminal domain-containing protein [Deltaproteobacteria bacterium]|nr:RsbRD N-terminal domain-containing protein [Deltaproteobacteria bacterium]
MQMLCMGGHPPVVRGTALAPSRGSGWTEVVVTLDEILAARRPHILPKWLDLIYALYPPEAKDFLQRERDPFANPVGDTMRAAAEALYGRLHGRQDGQPCPQLEQLMRLLAVQGICPSRAVGFLLALKRLMRAELAAHREGPALLADLEAVCDRIDHLTLEAVDLFATYRDKLSALQAQEARRSTQKLLERLQREREEEA